MACETILIIDDDKDIVDFIKAYLSNDGYKVLTACDGTQGNEILDANEVDLMILDIMMPGIDGIEVCRRIRQQHVVPIILLSAKSTEMDKLIGLSTGADDYIVKPFSPLELTARVKAQIRRYKYLNNQSTSSEPDTINIQGLTIDEQARKVALYGKPIELTKTEYDILLLLAKHPNRVFTSEEIFESVWKEKYFQSNNTVMVHISRLREKIEENPRKAEIIKNVWGVGYKIER
ncbi:response regulator transcription factor [Paenibacillus caui]|uniref:response regulator transcription factor n=1 Tax=Paenibacillus caui TaxID=2873927 RepID=UPI001CA82B82|nr:response regulator transcription factor [Paenibacillus caui]